MARYARGLLQALATAFPGDRWVLFAPGRDSLPGSDGLARLANVEIHRHPLPSRVLFGAAALTGRPRLDRLVGEPVDVVWAPTVAPLALSPDVPFVLTVQDLSFALRPWDFTAYEQAWHALARPRALARRARRVIVLASPTREQLVTRWGLDRERIRVVAPGIEAPGIEAPGIEAPPAADFSPLTQLGLQPGAYLLAVGALEPRKAPERLAGAFATARARGLTATLVFAGEGRLAFRLHGDGVRLLGRVDEPTLDALYRGAQALVVPSLLEGYGLPLREALARGTPAVVSDLAVFGSELDAAVIRVTPGDTAALAQALLRLAGEPGLRDRLAASAPATVAGLSWAEAARRTRAVLAEAIE